SGDIWVGNGSNVAAAVGLSGDAALSNAGALTLNTVNSNTGSWGTATSVPAITVNGKGLITAAANTAITGLAESAITNLPTDLSNRPTGSGTASYTARWTGTNTLGTGALYDNGTNVGIGTASPGAALEVASSANVDQLLNGQKLNWNIVKSNDAAVNDYLLAKLPISTSGTYDHLVIDAVVGGWGSNNKGAIHAVFGNRNQFTYTWTLENTVPTCGALRVYNNSGEADVYLYFPASTYCTASVSIKLPLDETVTGTPNDVGATPAGTLEFDSSSGSYPPDISAIAGGNVGIGTTSPTSLLYVNGAATVNGTATATTFSGSGASLTNLPWGSLTGSPTGCSAGTFATGASGSTLTCGTPSGVSPVGSALTSGDIWVGNGSNVAAAVGLSGDATLSNAGALTLAASGVTAGTYGNATTVPQLTLDAKGRVTGEANVTITGTTPGGTAGGVLSGSYPNPGFAANAAYPVAAANGNGIQFWNSGSSYLISMGNGTNYDYGPVTDYSIKTNMDGTAGRGVTWGVNAAAPTAALDSTGNMQIAGYLDIAGASAGAGNLRFAAANPYIYASSYIQVPGGLYVSGGTLYDQTQLQARGGIHNDTAAYLELDGGTSGNTYVNGNLGIGTTGPAHNLEVSGNAEIGTSAGTPMVTGHEVGSSYSYGDGIFKAITDNATGSSNYYFLGLTSNTTNFTVRADGQGYFAGNVGIGTTSPGETLDINGTARASGEIISTMTSGYGQFRMINGNYGSFLRNDGSNTYLLLTASGNQYGSWNSLRPFWVEDATGNLNLGNSSMYVVQGSAVGIGTITPITGAGNLTVAGTTFFGTGGSYQVSSVGAGTLAQTSVSGLNISQGANTDVFITATGLTDASSSNRIYISTGSATPGDGVASFNPATGQFITRGAQTANGTPDLAEYIQAEPDVEAGDVVAPSERASQTPGPGGERILVAQSKEPYQSGILGVISDGSSGFMIGSYLHDVNARYPGKPLVLAGRVPVKVDLEGGPIHIGDYLTSSSTPGYAMRASGP
ncbi:MAG: beta strand repeat-containing protein, partial [Elusimicrobiota bacterium]